MLKWCICTVDSIESIVNRELCGVCGKSILLVGVEISDANQVQSQLDHKR